MRISEIHSFLVHPGKHEDTQPQIAGTAVRLEGRLFNMLEELFKGAHVENDIDIVFKPQDDGTQQNDCRDLLWEYVRHPGLRTGTRVATRLQSVTTHRSGLGLLFLIVGDDDDGIRFVVARFAAEAGVLARERQRGGLSVQFEERVFMKNAKAYKSVLYQAPTLTAVPWDGRAVDRQINERREISDYWIADFLTSDLKTTAAAGTKWLAIALRTAINAADQPQVREELIFASQTIRRQHGRTTSAQKLAAALNFSDEARDLLVKGLPRTDLFGVTFRFSRDEYDQHVTFRSVKLDNGAVLLAEHAAFEEVFQRERVKGEAGKTRFTTEGAVVSEKLRKSPA